MCRFVPAMLDCRLSSDVSVSQDSPFKPQLAEALKTAPEKPTLNPETPKPLNSQTPKPLSPRPYFKTPRNNQRLDVVLPESIEPGIRLAGVDVRPGSLAP